MTFRVSRGSDRVLQEFDSYGLAVSLFLVYCRA